MSNLGAPEGFTVTGKDMAISAEWQPVEGADGYRLYYYAADNPDKCIKSRYSQGAHKTILGFKNGCEYLAAVCAFQYKGDVEILGELSEKLPVTPISKKLKAQNTICLETGGTAQLKWEYMNETPPVTFSSLDEKIAKVDENGVVTAVGAGITYIALATKDGSSCRTKIAVERGLGMPSGKAVLMFTGDIMCAVNHQRATAPEYDFFDAFSGIKETLRGADFAAGVLETICCDSAPYECEELRLGSGSPNCNSPSTFLSAVADAGFDALVTANNHNRDAGINGLSDTVAGIRARGMKNIGTLGDNPIIVDIKGIKVAILACTMITNDTGDDDFTGVNPTGAYDHDYFVELINTALVMGAEYIIAYQHWGRMNSTKVRKTQMEEARFMADAGANLIIGSHPHAVQKFSYVRTSDGRRVPCAYSLGNFLTTMNEMKENRDGLILRLSLSRGENGLDARLSYIPTMSELFERGAAVTTVYPPKTAEARESFLRTKTNLGGLINHFSYRPSILLNGSAGLSKIFACGRGFRVDKTGVLLSQLSLCSKEGESAANVEDARLKLDIEKNLPEYIQNTKPDYFALDFYGAATILCYKQDLGDEKSAFYTGSKKFKASEFYKAHVNELTRIRPPFGESVWKPIIKKYAEELLSVLPPERIILFRTRSDSKAVKGTELRVIDPKRSVNRFITALEDFFIELVNPCVVDLSGKYFLDASAPGSYEAAYYTDAYNAAVSIASDTGRTCVTVPDTELWFERVEKYYKNMTARAYQNWLLDMDCAADKIIAGTTLEFSARNRCRLIALKKTGKSDIARLKDFFVDDPGAEELLKAAAIIRALEAGNLNKSYDFFEPAFKGRYNILKTMIRLLSNEMGVSVNENSVELVFLLRGKPQIKRYITGLNRNTVDIWGSCVSRESINHCRDAYVGKYIFKQAPILAFEPPINAEFPESADAFCGSRWRRRTLSEAFERNGAEVIAKSSSRWILIDFYDLICQMAEYKGGLFEIDDFIRRTDFYGSIEKDCKECYLFEKRDMKYCFETMTRFAKIISERYGGNIILIKAEPKNTYITLDHRTARLEGDGMFEIKKKFISLCEERFANVTGCYCIDISKHFYASDEFPLGGAHIVHYEDEFYRQTGEYISEILRGTDRRVFSTVDDNYLLLRSLKLDREQGASKKS